MSDQRRRAVVTGVGATTPLGIGCPALWESLLAGRSGIAAITLYDHSQHSVHIAGEVKNWDGSAVVGREARRMDRFAQFAMAAADEAIADARLDFTQEDTTRVGVVIGTGIGGIIEIEEQKERLIAKGPSRVSAFLIPKLMANAGAGQVAIKHKLRGPNFCVVTACASGANSLESALRLIQTGICDIVVTGGSEAAIAPLGMAGFANMGALSLRNDAPEKASRPFDKERDGFVMGEGAGVVILEELDHAIKRGARMYAEFAGAGLSGDGHHITAPADNGDGGIRAMEAALRDAGLKPTDVDYVNAHGTSTPFNDKVESLAIRKTFGPHADKLAVNSTKSMTGHTLGAAGGIEAVVSVLSIFHSKLHPTINRDTPDPDCDLDYVTEGTRSRPVNVAISNSLGFGGHNATLAFKKVNL
jgi:3-oxoacyl-[acyl-carrier-protein] synthase II